MNEMTRVGADDGLIDKAGERGRLGRLRPWLLWSVPAILVAAALYLWLTSGRTVETDNATVEAHVVSVAPEVTGRIVDVAVAENDVVKSGQLLFRIDPAPFRIALESADAAVGNARISVARASSDYSAREADVGSKGSDVDKAREDFDRQSELMARGFTTRASFDAAKHALAAAIADRESASATASAARAALGSGGIHPIVASAIAQRDKAALDLARTEIRAPIGGRISQSDKLLPGNMAFTGLPSVSLVSGEGSWIEANFKETQLAKIRIGQSATVVMDAIPGKTYRARVIGIGAGTGSQFSLLPAQNATGNWVKVTQRVPVRLRLDDVPDRPLVAGWSADVTVDVSH